MSLDFYSGSYTGVKKISLPADEGVLVPFLQQVQAVDNDRVRFTFSRSMKFDEFITGTPIKILDPAYFTIREESTLSLLKIVKVYKKSDTEVEAICENMQNVQHIASVSPNLEDIHGTKLGSNNIEFFTGLSLVYPNVEDLYGFFGLYGGIQLVTINDITPDIEGPEISNKVPTPGTLVHPVYRVSFDITDRNNVNDDSIVIRVNDQVAWQNDIQQAGFTVKRTVIEDGYHFDVDSNEQYPYESVIPVRVQASDLASEPNTTDSQWTFSTTSRGPYAVYQFPLPGSEGEISSDIIIELKSKYGINVDTIKMWVSPGDDEPYEFAFDYSAYPRFKEGYDGIRSKVEPIDNGLRITLDRIDDYKVGNTVSVIVHSSEDE